MMQTLFRKLRFVFEIYYYYISIKKVRPLDTLIYIDTTNLVSCCGRVMHRSSSTVLHCISVNSDVPSVYLVLSLTNKFDLFLIENLNNLKINMKKVNTKKKYNGNKTLKNLHYNYNNRKVILSYSSKL